MNNLIKNGTVKELNPTELKSIEGGNWLTEGIAYLAGVFVGAMKAREEKSWDEINWEKKRVLVGG